MAMLSQYICRRRQLKSPLGSPPESPVAGSPTVDNPNTTSVAVESPETGMPPASFYLDKSRLVDSLIQSHKTSTNEGYQKLPTFSGRVPRPDGEEEFDSWMDQAMQAIEY